MSLTPATRWPVTIDSSTPATPQPARVATAANPITRLSRSEQFRFAPEARGRRSEMAATVARYLLHYVNIAPLKSPTRCAEINRRRSRRSERRPIGNVSICQRVTSRNGERIFLFFQMDLSLSTISNLSKNYSALANLMAAACYVTPGKTIALKQDSACKNRRDSAAGRRGGCDRLCRYADIERYGCYPLDPFIGEIAAAAINISVERRASAIAFRDTI